MGHRPKRLPIGEEMPRDFWNYDVNPITGYKTNLDLNADEKNKRDGKKYELRPQDFRL